MVVGYGVKIFHPSPPNYVTRSPGTFHLVMQKTKVPIFCICRDFHTIRESMFSVANIMPVIIPAVSKYLSEQSTPIAKESRGAKNAKMI